MQGPEKKKTGRNSVPDSKKTGLNYCFVSPHHKFRVWGEVVKYDFGPGPPKTGG